MATWSLAFHARQEEYFSNMNTLKKRERNSGLLKNTSESERNLIPSLYPGIRPEEIDT